MNHDIIFHLKDGEYRTGGTMSGIEEKLKRLPLFALFGKLFSKPKNT